MQNFFLSPSLGRDPDGTGNKAARKLLEVTIPAARKAGIRIVWLNWGLTDEELVAMPPATRRGFGLEKSLLQAAEERGKAATATDLPSQLDASQAQNGKPIRVYRGLGSELGHVVHEDGSPVDGGRLLFRHTWNAALPTALQAAYVEGKDVLHKPDVWIHKNRMSGLWGGTTPCTEFLEKEGIRTLLFAGVNTDQCVAGSLMDAYAKGWDCVLVKDCCGTTSPDHVGDGFIWNCERTWGFVAGSADVREGVERMIRAREKAS